MRIGVFDSGLGGLTVLRSLIAAEPNYDYLYLGDTARTPYGNRSFESILRFTWEAVDYLFEQDCQIIILACNTASAKALRTLQQKYLPQKYPDRRILGVIRPSAEYLANLYSQQIHLNSEPIHAAIWATSGTVRSQSYELELQKLAPNLPLVQQACPMLVPLIENGEENSHASAYFIDNYWKATLAQDPQVNTLLLGCTHYPLMNDQIKTHVGSNVTVLDQGQIVGSSWNDYLARHPEHTSKLDHKKGLKLLTTDRPELFSELASRILPLIGLSEQIHLPTDSLKFESFFKDTEFLRHR